MAAPRTMPVHPATEHDGRCRYRHRVYVFRSASPKEEGFGARYSGHRYGQPTRCRRIRNLHAGSMCEKHCEGVDTGCPLKACQPSPLMDGGATLRHRCPACRRGWHMCRCPGDVVTQNIGPDGLPLDAAGGA